jgi:hypothetical protein
MKETTMICEKSYAQFLHPLKSRDNNVQIPKVNYNTVLSKRKTAIRIHLLKLPGKKKNT